MVNKLILTSLLFTAIYVIGHSISNSSIEIEMLLPTCDEAKERLNIVLQLILRIYFIILIPLPKTKNWCVSIFSVIRLFQIQHLLAFNGKTSFEACRVMLEETFGHDMALKFNLSGKGKSGKKVSRS